MIQIDDDEAPSGSPAWMATFADLMSLLMCFFVLLLSFSEMDVLKYKQIAGSMKDAFGVQNRVKVKDIPKGTSIIAREFSPGDPKPTQIKTINQVTVSPTRQSLRVGNPDAPKHLLDINPDDLNTEQTKILLKAKLKSLIEETESDAEKLRAILKKEIEEGKVEVESRGRSITVRIKERGSFPSGSATINPEFIPVMGTLRESLKEIPGKIAIEGHSDNIPINTKRFRSNWDLSSARALAVTHELIQKSVLDSNRFIVIGLADTKPRQPNDTWENRAENRRVEIVIRQGLDVETALSIKNIQKSDPDALEGIDIDGETLPEGLNEELPEDLTEELSDSTSEELVETTNEGPVENIDEEQIESPNEGLTEELNNELNEELQANDGLIESLEE